MGKKHFFFKWKSQLKLIIYQNDFKFNLNELIEKFKLSCIYILIRAFSVGFQAKRNKLHLRALNTNSKAHPLMFTYINIFKK